MSGVPFDYASGVSNPSIDAFISKTYPGLMLNGIESPLGEYWEIREVNGTLWHVYNATFATALGGWQQVNPALISSAIAFVAGGGSIAYSVAAGTAAPFQFTPLTASSQYAMTVFAASGTFTTPTSSSVATLYRYRMISGGGGGGGTNGAGAAGGGGGAGAFVEGFFTGVAASTAIAVTVGTGGAVGANTGTAGGNGNATSLGTPISVTVSGGTGGSGSTSATAPVTVAGGAGGTLTSGTAASVTPGAHGALGYGVITTTMLIGGMGAGSLFGGGGVGAGVGNAAGSGLTYGSGGGGAVGAAGQGGGGGSGIVIIERMTL